MGKVSRYLRPVDRKTAYKANQGRCWHCDKQLRGKFDADHIVPWSLGGANHADNLVPSCANCNRSRQDLSIAEFDRRDGVPSRCQGFNRDGSACKYKVAPGNRKYCLRH